MGKKEEKKNKTRKGIRNLSYLCILAFAMCLCLTGCKNENVDTNNVSEQKEETGKVTVTEGAQKVASNFNLDYDNMGINYLIADGYMTNGDTGASVMLHLKDKKENEERKEDFVKLVEYFKSISDDGKATDGYSDWEADLISTTSVGTTCYIKLNGKEYTIFINQQNLTYNNKQYYTYNININNLA